MKLCRGLTRKVSIPFVVLFLLGWILYLVGFALRATERGVRTGGEAFPYWCFLFAGLLLFIFSVLHLLIGRWYTGIVTHFILCVYLVVGGAVVYNDANMDLFPSGNVAGNISEANGQLYTLIEWIGASISLLFVTFFVMMWPLYPDNRYD